MRERNVLITLFAFLICQPIFGQKMTLSDLLGLCGSRNWESVNQTLLTKNWSYYESKRGDSNKYNTITWSFNKQDYNDRAQAWFHLYTYEGYPNKIVYEVFNKESYSLIQNSLAKQGFILVNSDIRDNEIISFYSNDSYTLEISTEKRDHDSDEYNWDQVSTTAYNLTIIKKSGVFDSANGKKLEYYSDGSIKLEYCMSNGEVDGSIKVYNENGTIKRLGTFKNGFENGLFKEFDENGILTNEYNMVNGKRNGYFKVYEFQKLSYSCNYLDDFREGEYLAYYYNEESGILELKETGVYAADKKTGTWKLFIINDDGSEKIVKFEEYIDGVRNGAFQDANGDSLIIGNYRRDLLDGQYKIYLDVFRMLMGGAINTDTSQLVLISEGYYTEGVKTGYWKNYDATATLRSEGRFLNGAETGEWKYYYSNNTDEKRNQKPYSKQLYLSTNFLNGKLHGKSVRYSYLNKERVLCTESDNYKNLTDTCWKSVYQKVLETTFYKEGVLDGPCEVRDSLSNLIFKGNFRNSLKDGDWVIRQETEDVEGKPIFFYLKGRFFNDFKEGTWVKYFIEGQVVETFNYKRGELHGEYVEWSFSNVPEVKKLFRNGKLTEYIAFDSLGVMQRRYEIFDVKESGYRCRRTQYFPDTSYVSQVYWLKNEGEIEHIYFELNFLFSAGKLSDGTKGFADGEYLEINKFYQPVVSGKCYRDYKIGLWTFYFYDQNVKIESNFVDNQISDEKYYTLGGDLFSGVFIYNDEINGFVEERKIKDGLRNGKTIYLDKTTNKTVRKEDYKAGVRRE